MKANPKTLFQYFYEYYFNNIHFYLIDCISFFYIAISPAY